MTVQRSITRHPMGFTLVELLIALTLLGFLTMLMLAGFEVSVDAWRRVEARGTAGRDGQSAQAILRDRLSQAYPAVLTDESGAHRIDFAGGADRIEFLAPLPEREGARVFVRYRLYRDGATLRLAWSMTGLEDPAAPPQGDTIVLDDLRAFEIAYFGVDDPAAPPHWQNSWIGRTGLPPLIRLHVVRASGETARWPDLEVAPLVNADARCVFDASDGACRGL
jgi:general secretion pathway protein J